MKAKYFLLGLLAPFAMYSQQKTDTLQIENYIQNFQLKQVFKVTSDNEYITLNGYKSTLQNGKQVLDSYPTKRIVKLRRREVLAIWSTSFFPRISVLTVPFKIRRSQGDVPQLATSGLNNFGLHLAIPQLKLERYFWDGTKSTHALSLNLFAAPSVEELTPANTNNKVDASTKQFFVSAGISVVYSYNSIQLSFVPLGYDYATSSVGKDFIYNRRSWFGFGIGFDPRIFSPSANK